MEDAYFGVALDYVLELLLVDAVGLYLLRHFLVDATLVFIHLLVLRVRLVVETGVEVIDTCCQQEIAH